MALKKVWLKINGADRMLICNPDRDTLADVVGRTGFGGTRVSCKAGVCGSCSVILNGELTRACMKTMKSIPDYSEITTIEGIGTPARLHPLQQAWISCGVVQCGSCTAGFIVSAYALLLQNSAPTRQEVRRWFMKNHNECRCTEWKTILNAVMEAVRMQHQYNNINININAAPAEKTAARYGNPAAVPYTEAVSKVTGMWDFGEYASLMRLPGTLYLAVVHPKLDHGKIKSINVSEARQMPGVIKVITSKNIRGTNRIMTSESYPTLKTGSFEQPLISDDIVYCRSDAAAVVAAKSLKEAQAAAGKVKLQIEPLPAYMNYLEASSPEALEIHSGVPNEHQRFPFAKGEDTRKVLSETEYIAAGSFSIKTRSQTFPEPENIQAYLDEEGRVRIHHKTSRPAFPLKALALAAGVEENMIKIMENPKESNLKPIISPGSTALAAVCALSCKSSVNLLVPDEMSDQCQEEERTYYLNIGMGCDKEGRITALEYDFAYTHGAYAEVGYPIGARAIDFIKHTYDIPNVRALARAGFSNQKSGYLHKACDETDAYTMSEAIVDMLAAKAGIDPFEFRCRNLKTTDISRLDKDPGEYFNENLMDKARPYYMEAKARAVKGDSYKKSRGVGIGFGALDYGMNAEHQILINGRTLYFAEVEVDSQTGEFTVISMKKFAPNEADICNESHLTGGDAAVLNAVNDAAGVWIYDLPLTSEKIKDAIKVKEAGENSEPDPFYLGSQFFDDYF